MSEWGPWIEHDGKGCPCLGQYVHIVLGDSCDPTADPVAESADYGWNNGYTPLSPSEAVGIAKPGGSWDWAISHYPVIRYRIRKPLGLTILENLIADLPAPVGPKVDA